MKTEEATVTETSPWRSLQKKGSASTAMHGQCGFFGRSNRWTATRERTRQVQGGEKMGRSRGHVEDDKQRGPGHDKSTSRHEVLQGVATQCWALQLQAL